MLKLIFFKFADDDIKRTLQKMARQDNQKIKTIDKQLDSELS